MNFLSHFYFDRHSKDPNLVIGSVLPDLVKNARKDWSLRPEKQEESLYGQEALKNIYSGWKRHMEVDRYFHSSDFFCSHTQEIRTGILPALEKSPARPSFVAHIALELMLDSLLLTQELLAAEKFYALIEQADRKALAAFLTLNGVENPSDFFRYLDEFIEASYLNSYREADNIMYALSRICMRIWDDPFNQTQKLQLTAALINYQEKLQNDFLRIFDEIDRLLN